MWLLFFQVEKQCSYMRERLAMPVLVGVYYESLCPDSRDFIVDKLQKVYNKLSDITFLELVPYGNAKVCNATVMLQSVVRCPDIVMVRPWTTVELLELVWPLCQGTGNVEPADRVTPGFGPSSLTLHLSTLV